MTTTMTKTALSTKFSSGLAIAKTGAGNLQVKLANMQAALLHVDIKDTLPALVDKSSADAFRLFGNSDINIPENVPHDHPELDRWRGRGILDSNGSAVASQVAAVDFLSGANPAAPLVGAGALLPLLLLFPLAAIFPKIAIIVLLLYRFSIRPLGLGFFLPAIALGLMFSGTAAVIDGMTNGYVSGNSVLALIILTYITNKTLNLAARQGAADYNPGREEQIIRQTLECLPADRITSPHLAETYKTILEDQAASAAKDDSPKLYLGAASGICADRGDPMAPMPDAPFQITLNDFFAQHIKVTGATGSGKTQGVLLPLIDQLAQIIERFGLAVMCEKAVLPLETQEVFEHHGKSGEYKLIRPGLCDLAPWEGLKIPQIEQITVEVAGDSDKGGDGKYFVDQGRKAFRSALVLADRSRMHGASGKDAVKAKFTIETVYKIVTQDSYRADVATSIPASLYKTDGFLAQALEYWQAWATQTEEYRCYVMTTVSGWLDAYLSNEDMLPWAKLETGFAIESVFTGAKCGVAVPEDLYGLAGKMTGAFLRARLRNAAFRRGDWKPGTEQTRVCIIHDEIQDAPAADLEGLAGFVSRCRSLGIQMTIATQSDSALIANIARANSAGAQDTAKALLTNFRGKITFNTNKDTYENIATTSGVVPLFFPYGSGDQAKGQPVSVDYLAAVRSMYSNYNALAGYAAIIEAKEQEGVQAANAADGQRISDKGIAQMMAHMHYVAPASIIAGMFGKKPATGMFALQKSMALAQRPLMNSAATVGGAGNVASVVRGKVDELLRKDPAQVMEDQSRFYQTVKMSAPFLIESDPALLEPGGGLAYMQIERAKAPMRDFVKFRPYWKIKQERQQQKNEIILNA